MEYCRGIRKFLTCACCISVKENLKGKTLSSIEQLNWGLDNSADSDSEMEHGQIVCLDNISKRYKMFLWNDIKEVDFLESSQTGDLLLFSLNLPLRGEERSRTTTKEPFDLAAIIMKNIKPSDPNNQVYVFWLKIHNNAFSQMEKWEDVRQQISPNKSYKYVIYRKQCKSMSKNDIQFIMQNEQNKNQKFALNINVQNQKKCKSNQVAPLNIGQSQSQITSRSSGLQKSYL